MEEVVPPPPLLDVEEEEEEGGDCAARKEEAEELPGVEAATATAAAVAAEAAEAWAGAEANALRPQVSHGSGMLCNNALKRERPSYLIQPFYTPTLPLSVPSSLL